MNYPVNDDGEGNEKPMGNGVIAFSLSYSRTTQRQYVGRSHLQHMLGLR